VDGRVEAMVDESISVGDYVVLGGEAPCLIIIEGLVRLIPGLIRELSHRRESFENGLLDYPVYTKPREYRGMEVPPILLSGDHALVEAYRFLKSIERTLERRPDLLKSVAEDLREILKRKGVVKDVGFAGEDNAG
jgi:tRNA (guanine37-N1)-methyltransferase